MVALFSSRSSEYCNDNYYKSSEAYLSCGAKVVSMMRIWFVQQITEKLSASSPEDKAREDIEDELSGEDSGKFGQYEDMQTEFGDCLGDLSDMGSIQFGVAMNLSSITSTTSSSYQMFPWYEYVALSVNQEPNYLDFKAKEDDDGNPNPWYFNSRNTCLFGPTGLPLIPSPVTPWVCTINLWSIDLEGRYEEVTLMDTLDETHANPLFGHSGQSYKRIRQRVDDELCSKEAIGENMPIEFNFWTMNIGIVPPNKLPIGDVLMVEEDTGE